MIPVIIGAVAYVLVTIAVARYATRKALDNSSYLPYDAIDYAGAGILGVLIGLFWLPMAVAFGAVAAIGWLLARG